MTDLRADLETAYWEHWRKALRDNPRDGLPAFLDRLEEIIREQVPDGVISSGGELTDAQLAELRRQLDDLDAKRAKPAATGQPAAPAKPATRRRTTR